MHLQTEKSHTKHLWHGQLQTGHQPTFSGWGKGSPHPPLQPHNPKVNFKEAKIPQNTKLSAPPTPIFTPKEWFRAPPPGGPSRLLVQAGVQPVSRLERNRNQRSFSNVALIGKNIEVFTASAAGTRSEREAEEPLPDQDLDLAGWLEFLLLPQESKESHVSTRSGEHVNQEDGEGSCEGPNQVLERLVQGGISPSAGRDQKPMENLA